MVKRTHGSFFPASVLLGTPEARNNLYGGFMITRGLRCGAVRHAPTTLPAPCSNRPAALLRLPPWQYTSLWASRKDRAPRSETAVESPPGPCCPGTPGGLGTATSPASALRFYTTASRRLSRRVRCCAHVRKRPSRRCPHGETPLMGVRWQDLSSLLAVPRRAGLHLAPSFLGGQLWPPQVRNRRHQSSSPPGRARVRL